LSQNITIIPTPEKENINSFQGNLSEENVKSLELSTFSLFKKPVVISPDN
jgi:hypothetical protein